MFRKLKSVILPRAVPLEPGPGSGPEPQPRESWRDEGHVVDESKYRLLGQVDDGEGGEGTVYKAQHRLTGQWLACKCIDVSSLTVNDSNFTRGIEEALKMDILADGPHIIKIRDFEVIEGERHYEVRIYTDFHPGGNLMAAVVDCVRRRVTIPESAIVDIARQIAEALSFCHARGFWHRDLKPQNVLLETKWSRPESQEAPNVVLIDFGLARFAGNATSTRRTFVGTPAFYTPEMIISGTSSAEGDIFNFGEILYCLMVLEAPRSVISMYNFSPSRLPSTYSAALRNLVAQMLRGERRERPSINEVSRRLLLIPKDQEASEFDLDDFVRTLGIKTKDEPPRNIGWRGRRANSQTTCRYCNETFSTRNDLFDHLRNLPWHQT